ncbi:MAG: dihydropteroate synthase [Pseudomonadota bacterium]|nr:dihydropteroate synthase [Pseudomonadota bacterium]
MVILGLGSNIGNRKKNISRAIWEIEFQGLLANIKVSTAFESDALLPKDSPDSWNIPFLNLAISGDTTFSPFELLDLLKEIEKKIGREKCERWAPREIDIDILSWGTTNIESEKLKVPHPEILKRPFALLPLLELAPLGLETNQVLKEWQKKTPFNTKPISWQAGMPQLVGILNLTPDSFSDGEARMESAVFVKKLHDLVASGAQVIDIGAESTRPGASPLSAEKEIERLKCLFPEILKIVSQNNLEVEISIDTYHHETAKKLLELKVDWINDVSGVSDEKMISVLKDFQGDIVFMHNLGIPANKNVTLDTNCDATEEIMTWANEKTTYLEKMGIQKDRLIFDPGIGFGKTSQQSLEILKRIEEFKILGVRLMVGHSRKSFLSQFTLREFGERDIETVGASTFLATKRIHYLRVHDIELHKRVFNVLGPINR